MRWVNRSLAMTILQKARAKPRTICAVLTILLMSSLFFQINRNLPLSIILALSWLTALILGINSRWAWSPLTAESEKQAQPHSWTLGLLVSGVFLLMFPALFAAEKILDYFAVAGLGYMICYVGGKLGCLRCKCCGWKNKLETFVPLQLIEIWLTLLSLPFVFWFYVEGCVKISTLAFLYCHGAVRVLSSLRDASFNFHPCDGYCLVSIALVLNALI